MPFWSKVATGADGRKVEIRIPRDSGIAGAVATSGRTLNIPDAYADERFDRSVDRDSGFTTRSILCVPLVDRSQRVFGVAQILNKKGDQPFEAADERRFAEFIGPMGIILESWWNMSHRDAKRGAGTGTR